MALMKTGELANRAGVTIETIRFYERNRLLREPSRLPSGYRIYTEQDLQQVRFIRDCQELGFTLKEIKQLIELHGFFSTPRHGKAVPSEQGSRMMEIARERLAFLDHKLQVLSQIRERLWAAVHESQARHAPVCPAQQGKRSAVSAPRAGSPANPNRPE